MKDNNKMATTALAGLVALGASLTATSANAVPNPNSGKNARVLPSRAKMTVALWTVNTAVPGWRKKAMTPRSGYMYQKGLAPRSWVARWPRSNLPRVNG